MSRWRSVTASLVAAGLAVGACGGTTLVESGSGCPAGQVCTPLGSGGSTSSDSSAGSTGGGNTSGTGGTAAWGNLAVLDYRVVDAKHSEALKSLVIVSDTPSNALHIFNLDSGMDRPVALPSIPVAVALEPSGLVAAVAYDAGVAWVDLQTGAVQKTCPVTSNAYDVAAAANGVAYVMPRTDQWVNLHAIDGATCAETIPMSLLYAGQHLALHPSGKAVFAADQGLSPSRINRCDIASSPIVCDDSEGQNDWGTYSYCGKLWISADGSRIYSGCGVTLRVPGNVTKSVCTYGGTMPGVTRVQYLDEAAMVGKVVLIPGVDPTSPDDNADAIVRVHETSFLGFVAEHPLPSFPLSGTNVAVAHGRFVFTAPSMDKVFVIVQADPSSGAAKDFAIGTLKL